MQRIIVIGAGFAGVALARALRKAQRRGQLELVVFNRDNHMVFQPLLAEVAGSALNPRAVAAPLRQLLRGIDVRTEEVLDIDHGSGDLVYSSHDGQSRRMHYDQLVLACGQRVNLGLLPGMSAHALPLKTVGDAIALRAQVMQRLEQAEAADSEEQRRFYLGFIVIGGGFSGVEVAGEINDLVRHALPYYQRLRAADVRVTLLHSQPQILPEVAPALRDFAAARMRKAQIDVRTGVRASAVSARGVLLADGERVPGATVVSTVGTTAQSLIARLDLPKQNGRIRTDAHMQVQGHTGIWAIGDCAAIPNAHDQQLSPPTAQFAERQGKQLAANLLRQLDGRPTEAFRFKPLGAACGIGGRRGVAQVFGMRLAGFSAWWVWRSAFLLKLPSVVQKLKVGFDWAWELLFPRDLSHFRNHTSEPLIRQYFGDGEVLLQPGQTRSGWLVVETGEVELRHQQADGLVVDSVLGRGALLGAHTLNGSTEAQLCARGPVEVFAVDEQTLGRLSQALAPLQAALARSVQQPRLCFWRHHPAALAGLGQRRAGQLADRDFIQLPAGTPVPDALKTLLTQRAQWLVVVHDDGQLAGLIEFEELLRAVPRAEQSGELLRELLLPELRFVRTDQPAAEAAGAMSASSSRAIVVVDTQRRPVGLLRADELLRFSLLEAQVA